jgi:hypothetical protein
MAGQRHAIETPRCWRSWLRHARRIAAVIVAGTVTALAGTACTAAAPGPGAAGHGPPPSTVLTQGASNGNGDIFIAPQGGGGYASGPEILTNTGKVIWFHALPAGEVATDFRTQTYQGRPVLTWFQGRGLSGTDYIDNDRYQQIAKVRARNGYFTDFHEFLITPRNTALILADAMGTANQTSIGGPADQKVFNGIVQEINIRTGKVLFQWNSADHVPYRESHNPRPARRPLATGTCSPAGARCPTSPSSAHPGTCCSTHSSRLASAPTAPTACPGTRPSEAAGQGVIQIW